MLGHLLWLLPLKHIYAHNNNLYLSSFNSEHLLI